MKDLLLDIYDWFCEVGILILLIGGLLGFLIYCGYRQEVNKEKCKNDGGVVIEHYAGYQCLTKEELQKLRGD